MISIVMSYYNRISQLRFTLKSIQEYSPKNLEIVIVDDHSSAEHSLDNLKNEFKSLNLKIIKMQDLFLKKDYVNPSIPYNIGFRNSTGDKIIIQNPECSHVGNIPLYVEENLTDDNYLSFHCYACGKTELHELHQKKYLDLSKATGKWYNHQVHRPLSFHFTTAITRKNLVELNGFDERYATGYNYDDAEFVERIKLKGLDIKFVEKPYVIHQYHGKLYNKNPMNSEQLQNNEIFHFENMKNLSIKAPNKEQLL
jgi:GT2 family glycosyltransferase